MLSQALAAVVVVSMVFFPLAQLASAATELPGTQTDATPATAPTSGSQLFSAVPSVLLDTAFTPLPRGGASPWDGEFQLDGIDGLSYNTPGLPVMVRAMSSNAFFVDEVWLVYPRVQYLFNNKDVPDLGNQFGAIQFSQWITVGTFPPGTELIFGVKTGVGIDDKCQDRIRKFKWIGGSATPPSGLEARDYSSTDSAEKLSLVAARPDLWQDVGALNEVMDRHHCYKITQDPTWVPLPSDPQRVCGITDDACRNKAWPSQTPDGRSIFYTGPGIRNVKDDAPHGRFQFLTCSVRLAAGESCPAANVLTNTALFGLEDVGAPVTGDWHPDFQDAGIVVWPALAATCQSTTVQNRVVIVGQEGYGSVTLRDASQSSPFPQSFRPGDAIDFTVNTGAPVGVTGASPSWAINLHGQALMSITDDTKAAADPNRTLDAGICFDPVFPPLPIIKAITGNIACDAAWDFTISGVNATTAPPSIRVKWTNDQTPPADEAATIPLTSIGADGIAHYRSDLFTSLRVVEASATSPTLTWSGTFSLAKGPCPVIKTADLTAACPVAGATEWDITISGTTQLQAPPSVHVTWEGGAQADVTLSGTVGADGIAHYRTTQNLATAITAATASIRGAWTGEFKVNGGPCPGKKQLTLTVIPACTVGVTSWDITLSQMTQALAPLSVSAIWSGQTVAEAVALTGTVGADGIAHYSTGAHTGTSYADLTSVSANITFATPAEAAAFTGALAVPGVPCPPPPPSPSPSPSVPPAVLGRCEPIYNPAGKHIPDAGENPRSGDNPDGFYRLAAPTGWTVKIKDTQSAYMTPAFPAGTTIKLTEANGRTPTYWVGPGATHYEVRLQGDAQLWFYDAGGALVNKTTCYVPTHPKGSGDPSPKPTPTACVLPSSSPRPTPTRTPSPSPQPTGTGSGSKGGTRGGASSAATSANTNSRTNSKTASASRGGTNSASNAGTNSGSESGTRDGSEGGTNAATESCSIDDGPNPSPSPSPNPSPSAMPLIHVKTSTLAGHECNTSEWHFVITQVTTLNAPLTITVRWANGQSAVLPLERVTGGTAHYRTTLYLNSAVVDATANMSGTYGQFNVSHGPCLLVPSPSPSPSLTTTTTTSQQSTPKPSASAKPQKVEFVGNDSSGGLRTITLRVRIPGTSDYRTVTVTIPRDR